MTQPIEEQEIPGAAEALTKALTSLFLVVCGTVALGIGVAVAWSPAGSAIVVGAVVVLVGILIGLSS